MSDAEDLENEIARLKAENESLKSQRAKSGPLSFRVSEKGAVSVYGLGRFPVTLYQEQWDRLFAGIDDLKRFVEENRSHLKKKE